MQKNATVSAAKKKTKKVDCIIMVQGTTPLGLADLLVWIRKQGNMCSKARLLMLIITPFAKWIIMGREQ